MAERLDWFIHANTDGKGAALIENADGLLLGVTGVHALAGRALRTLLSSPGSWPGRPAEGSILANVTGSNVDSTTLKTDILRSVSYVEDYLKRQQLERAYPVTESLRSMEVIDVTFPTVDKAIVRIMVTALDGGRLLTGTVLEA